MESMSVSRTELTLDLPTGGSARTMACVSTLFVNVHKTVLLGATTEGPPASSSPSSTMSSSPLPAFSRSSSAPPASPLPPLLPLPSRRLVPPGTVQETLRRLSRRVAAAEAPPSRATPARRSLTFAERRRYWSRRSEGRQGTEEAGWPRPVRAGRDRGPRWSTEPITHAGFQPALNER